MKVREIFCNNSIFENSNAGLFHRDREVKFEKEKELFTLVKTSLLSSNARYEADGDKVQIIGDATEAAFVSFALDVGVSKRLLTEEEPRIKEISFSSERRMMSIVRKSDRNDVIYCKGSPSVILDKCSSEFSRNELSTISKKRKEELLEISMGMEKKGLRVMAFAYKNLNSNDNLESGLIFIGLIGLMDPPRKEIKEALRLCQEAGIKVKMITGDSLLTAKTVADEIGIKGEVIGGRDLESLSDEELINKIDSIAIFARIEPRQKLRIVEILQKKNEQVAITGDGVNDILALKKAHIGVAMGKRGSDIAREVSDMILLDDNFISIIKGIEEGRIVYSNSKKATNFLIASNFGEIALITLAVLISLPLPLLPLQILWINLITDSIPAFALTKESEEGIMKKAPLKERSILQGIFLPSMFASILAVLACLAIFYYGTNHSTLEHARTLVMLSLIGFETLFVLTCRSDKPLIKIGFFSNPTLVYSILIVFFLQAVLLFTPLGYLFKLTSINFTDLFFIILASLPGVLFFELYKMWKYLKNKQKNSEDKK